MKKIQFFSFLLMVLLGTACKKDKSNLQNGTDVYIACEFEGNDFSRAAYWKNNEFTVLDYDNEESGAYDVVAQNRDVWFVGRYDGKPCYWKNMQKTMINNSTGVASSVAVYNNSIHIIGSISSDRSFLWSSGTFNLLPEGFGANKIKFIGADRYIVGSMNGKAAYLKNSITTPEVISDITSYTNDITIAGADIYLVGSAVNSSGFYRSAYWKNGNIIRPEIMTGISLAEYANGNLYFAGSNANGQGILVTNNEQVTVLSQSNESYYISDLLIDGSDVYISGNDDENTGNIPWYWKNNSKTILNRSAQVNAYAYGMYIHKY